MSAESWGALVPDRRQVNRGVRLVRLWVYGITYALFVSLISISAALTPAAAFQLSPVAYSRVIVDAEMIAMQAAARLTLADAVAAAAIIPTPVGLAIKVVAVGLTAVGLTLGIPLGTALYELDYSGADLEAVRNAAAPVVGFTVPNVTYPIAAGGACPAAPYQGAATCTTAATYDQYVAFNICGSGQPYVPMPENWIFIQNLNTGSGCAGGLITRIHTWGHLSGTSSAGQTVTTPATQTQVADAVAALPSSDPYSLEARYRPQGLGVPSEAPAGVPVVSVPVTVPEAQTVVKPTTEVLPTDTVVVRDVPPPVGTVTQAATTNTVTKTTTGTKTETVVVNPDGSTTTTTTASSTETEEQTGACAAAGNHDFRTPASVMSAHWGTWQESSFVGSLAVFSNLVFPGSIPVLTFPTTLFGNFTVDLTTYGWVFTAIQSIMIAVAGMVAVRLVFAGRA
jgi:hypothetical protein